MLLPILDVERDLKRRGLTRRDENALRLLDHVLDPLHLGVWSLESDDYRVVAIIVGDVGQDLPLVRELVPRSRPTTSSVASTVPSTSVNSSKYERHASRGIACVVIVITTPLGPNRRATRRSSRCCAPQRVA